jgi:hypothetical protein
MQVPRWLVWATLFGAGTAYEVHEIREGDGGTLTELVRLVTHTEHPVGRWAFLIGWGAFSAWFANHIIAGRADPSYVQYLASRPDDKNLSTR